MMRRLTSSPKPCVRVAIIISFVVGASIRSP
jgi:hypothetical protein